MEWVGEWDHVSLVVVPFEFVETIQLEEGQSFILVEFDHISDLVHLGICLCNHISYPFFIFI